MSDVSEDFKRWRQAVRRQVRMLAKEHGASLVREPALLLWVAESPRKPGTVYTPGQEAEGVGDVATRVRESIRNAGARFAAMGRVIPAEPAGVKFFMLISAASGEVERWEAMLMVDGEALEVGAWETAPVELDHTVELMQAGFRDVEA